MVVYTRLDTVDESIIFNACHAIGNYDGGQVTATIKSFISYVRYTVGNGSILTARYQLITIRFNNSITPLT